MKKVAIIQSNYIPWKGYFHMINKVDEFILYDEVQYTKRDWRNRNQIKTANGLLWLTIPVEVKGKFFQAISDTKIADPGFATNHWKSITYAYSKAKYFSKYSDLFEAAFNAKHSEYISLVNYSFIKVINQVLDINTKISWSSDYPLAKEIMSPNDRLIDLCLQSGANLYLSGPAAKSYMDLEQFKSLGLDVEWMDYSSYQPYNQLYGDFVHGVSVLDLIFNEGPDAAKHIRA